MSQYIVKITHKAMINHVREVTDLDEIRATRVVDYINDKSLIDWYEDEFELTRRVILAAALTIGIVPDFIAQEWRRKA